MRLSSLLLGGVIGASTVWVLSNRNHPIVNMMKLMKQNSMSKDVTNKKSAQKTQQHAYSEQTRAENASLIRSIIEQDPKLQREFNSISSQATAEASQGTTAEQAQQH